METDFIYVTITVRSACFLEDPAPFVGVIIQRTCHSGRVLEIRLTLIKLPRSIEAF